MAKNRTMQSYLNKEKNKKKPKVTPSGQTKVWSGDAMKAARGQGPAKAALQAARGPQQKNQTSSKPNLQARVSGKKKKGTTPLTHTPATGERPGEGLSKAQKEATADWIEEPLDYIFGGGKASQQDKQKRGKTKIREGGTSPKNPPGTTGTGVRLYEQGDTRVITGKGEPGQKEGQRGPTKQNVKDYAAIARNAKIRNRMEAGDYREMGATEFTERMEENPSALLEGGLYPKQDRGTKGPSRQQKISRLQSQRQELAEEGLMGGGMEETFSRMGRYKSLGQQVEGLRQTDREVGLQKLRNQAAIRTQQMAGEQAMEQQKAQTQADFITSMIEGRQDQGLTQKERLDAAVNVDQNLQGTTVPHPDKPDQIIAYDQLTPEQQAKIRDKKLRSIYGGAGINIFGEGEDPNDPLGGVRDKLNRAKQGQ